MDFMRPMCSWVTIGSKWPVCVKMISSWVRKVFFLSMTVTRMSQGSL